MFPVRPLLAAVLSIVILAGMSWFMARKESHVVAEAASPAATEVMAGFGLRVTATADLGPDPFALNVEQAASLVVTALGKQLASRDSAVPAGDTVELQLPPFVSGERELVVQAWTAPSESARPAAIQVQLTRDGIPFGLPQLGWIDRSATTTLVTVPLSSNADDVPSESGGDRANARQPAAHGTLARPTSLPRNTPRAGFVGAGAGGLEHG